MNRKIHLEAPNGASCRGVNAPLEKAVIAVAAEDASHRPRAEAIAASLSLPVVDLQGIRATDAEWVLRVGGKGLALVPVERRSEAGGGLRIDFSEGTTGYRRMAAGSTRQPLARALGLRQGKPHVLDATAGLGRDAFLLACLGCRVTAIERSPILALMLMDAVDRGRGQNDSQLSRILSRLSVQQGDARAVLESLGEEERPEVVYLDPMYTPREATALAKKEMRICRMVVGGDEDAAELLRAARRVARKRVVVKRHRHAEPLSTDDHISYKGRTVRYDVYRTQAQERT